MKRLDEELDRVLAGRRDDKGEWRVIVDHTDHRLSLGDELGESGTRERNRAGTTCDRASFVNFPRVVGKGGASQHDAHCFVPQDTCARG
jgi:hypothetical protein